MKNLTATKLIAISFVSALGLAPLSAMATPADATKATDKSERAMTPDSAKDGGSPNEKSERALDKSASQPGSSPNGNSERAMDPAAKAK